MAGKKVPVIFNFKVLDEVSGPLHKLNQKLENTFQPFKKLNTQMGRFGRASGFSAIAGFATKATLALGAMGVAGAYGLKRLADHAIETNSALGETSQRIGISSQALERWRFVAEQTGGSAEDLDQSLMFFSKTLSKARRGQGELVELLGKGNPFLTQLVAVKDTNKAFDYFIRQMRRVKNAQDRIAFGKAGLGRGAEEILGLATISDAQSDALMDQRVKMGQLTDEQVAAYKDFGDKQKAFSTRLEFMSSKAIGKLLPLFERMLTKLENWITKNEATFDKLINTFANVIPELLDRMLPMLEALLKIMNGLAWITGVSDSGEGGRKATKHIYESMFPAQAFFWGKVMPALGMGGGPEMALSTPTPKAPSEKELKLIVDFLNMPKGVKATSKNPKGEIGLNFINGMSMSGN